ncbi:hypothetical protein [Mangrovibacter yixingensis]|uniref:hypothetical protein n=1 Tax=Mangrovibacter yixingensis TaxID=1529639 RepID=UPI001CF97DAE|nr:hypothetical protein [Mangrovibacter yixingensis]
MIYLRHPLPKNPYPSANTLHFPHKTAWITVLCTTIVVLVLGLTTLDETTLTLSRLLQQTVLLPFFSGALVISLFLCAYLFRKLRHWNRDSLYGQHLIWWKNKTSEAIQIAEHASLFPVDNATLKILNLEGEMPASKDIPRKLPITPDEHNGLSRTQQALSLLLSKLSFSALKNPEALSEIWLFIRHGNDQVFQDAVTLFRQYYPQFNDVAVHTQATTPDRSMLDEWIAKGFTGFRLLVSLELHTKPEDEFCEHGTAFLFCWNEKVASQHVPVWYFSSVTSPLNTLTETVQILFATERVPSAKLRHLWRTNISGEGKYLLEEAINAAGFPASSQKWHTLQPTDQWSTGYLWLMLEWAASAVRHGQQGQLLAAAPSLSEINITHLSSYVPYHETDYETREAQSFKYTLFASLSMGLCTIFASNLFSAIFLTGAGEGNMSDYLISSILVFYLIILAIIVFNEFRYQNALFRQLKCYYY